MSSKLFNCFEKGHGMAVIEGGEGVAGPLDMDL